MSSPFDKFREAVLVQLEQLQHELGGFDAREPDGTDVASHASPMRRAVEQYESQKRSSFLKMASQTYGDIANGDMAFQDRDLSTRGRMDELVLGKLPAKQCPELTAKAMDTSVLEIDGAIDGIDGALSSSEKEDSFNDFNPPVSKTASLHSRQQRSRLRSSTLSSTPEAQEVSGVRRLSTVSASFQETPTGGTWISTASQGYHRTIVPKKRRVSAMAQNLPEQFHGLTIEEALQKAFSGKKPNHMDSGDQLGRTSVDFEPPTNGSLVRETSGVGQSLSAISSNPAGISSSMRQTLARQGSGPLAMNMESIVRKGRGPISDMVHSFLDVPDSSQGALIFGLLLNGIVIFSVGVTLTQSMEPPLISSFAMAVMQITLESLFLLEMIVRFLCIPDRYHFFRVWFNYIDILSVVPLFCRAAVGFDLDKVEGDDETTIALLLVTAVPILRMLKLLRRFQKFLLLQHAFADCAEAMPVLGFTTSLIVLVFSCLIYVVEPRSNIPTLADAMWLTIVTMTTVGYGDYLPTSAAGKLVVGSLITCSVLYMAIPIGIVGAAFNEVWKRRDCILLVKRTRDQMVQLGYTAVDIPCLFKLFDSDNDGELGRGDFVRMIASMNITLPAERVIQLFDEFDSDGGGSIDAIEFIRHVFPKAYSELYGNNLDDDDETRDEVAARACLTE